ncbi:hypothetical protein [Kitasatospora purpeofusca]|uniref:hypothetical protein n=1 Tax=Kitasatospora purpeofusca TaxID=67352 RepID=UPI003691A528
MLAALDATLFPDARTRRFDMNWRDGIALSQMDDMAGGFHRIVFDPVGIFAYGFDKTAQISPWRVNPREHWPSLLSEIPSALEHYLQEPSFHFNGFFDVTTCLWNLTESGSWETSRVELPAGKNPDGAEYVFDLLHGDLTPASYVDWIEFMTGIRPNLDAVSVMFSSTEIDMKVINALNSHVTLDMINTALETTGFVAFQ